MRGNHETDLILPLDGPIFIKQMRARAAKTWDFINDRSFAYSLLIGSVIVGCLEKVMHDFLKMQSDDTWLSSRPPLVQMSNMLLSPAAHSVHELCHLLETGTLPDTLVTFYDLAEMCGYLSL